MDSKIELKYAVEHFCDIISGRNRILLGNDTIMSSDKEIAHSIAIYKAIGGCYDRTAV